MRQEESATECNQAGENKTSLGGGHTLRLHSPFEYPEHRDQDFDNAMRKDNRTQKAAPKTVCAQRPILRVTQQKKDQPQGGKQEWPVLRVAESFRTAQKRQQADWYHYKCRPMVGIV